MCSGFNIYSGCRSPTYGGVRRTENGRKPAISPLRRCLRPAVVRCCRLSRAVCPVGRRRESAWIWRLLSGQCPDVARRCRAGVGRGAGRRETPIAKRTEFVIRGYGWAVCSSASLLSARAPLRGRTARLLRSLHGLATAAGAASGGLQRTRAARIMVFLPKPGERP